MVMENYSLKQKIVELEGHVKLLKERLKSCKNENMKLKETFDKDNHNRRRKIPL